jgi:hypothetical protein
VGAAPRAGSLRGQGAYRRDQYVSTGASPASIPRFCRVPSQCLMSKPTSQGFCRGCSSPSILLASVPIGRPPVRVDPPERNRMGPPGSTWPSQGQCPAKRSPHPFEALRRTFIAGSRHGHHRTLSPLPCHHLAPILPLSTSEAPLSGVWPSQNAEGEPNSKAQDEFRRPSCLPRGARPFSPAIWKQQVAHGCCRFLSGPNPRRIPLLDTSTSEGRSRSSTNSHPT